MDVRGMALKELAANIIMGEENTAVNISVTTPGGKTRVVTLIRKAA